MVIPGIVLYYKMPKISKAKKQRLESIAKARAQNPKHTNKNNNSNVTQLDISNNSESDVTPEDLIVDDELLQVSDSDHTPEDLDLSDSQDPDFLPLPPKLMIIPDSFLALLMQFVLCSSCKKQGQILPNVTRATEFQNEITFVCRCKHSFSLQTFPNNNINEVLIRNAVSNGIQKQPFQRFLQIGNFGANVDGKEVGINLFTRNSSEIYKRTNQQIIDGAEQMHKEEVEHLFRANQAVKISYDASYPKRGYHSPAAHGALICNKKVIDATTVKRASHTSETAYGDIVDKPANKLEQYAITKMLKHLIPHIGPLIVQIDLDQDASLQKVIETMKWTAEDVEIVNKWTGRKEITQDMIGKSVWGGKIPKIHYDKVSLFQLASFLVPNSNRVNITSFEFRTQKRWISPLLSSEHFWFWYPNSNQVNFTSFEF